MHTKGDSIKGKPMDMLLSLAENSLRLLRETQQVVTFLHYK